MPRICCTLGPARSEQDRRHVSLLEGACSFHTCENMRERRHFFRHLGWSSLFTCIFSVSASDPSNVPGEDQTESEKGGGWRPPGKQVLRFKKQRWLLSTLLKHRVSRFLLDPDITANVLLPAKGCVAVLTAFIHLQDYLVSLHDLHEDWLVHQNKFKQPAPVLVSCNLLQMHTQCVKPRDDNKVGNGPTFPVIVLHEILFTMRINDAKETALPQTLKGYNRLVPTVTVCCYFQKTLEGSNRLVPAVTVCCCFHRRWTRTRIWTCWRKISRSIGWRSCADITSHY